jgi:hypothetical protein
MVEQSNPRRPAVKARPRPHADFRQISCVQSETLSIGFHYLADAERGENEQTDSSSEHRSLDP